MKSLKDELAKVLSAADDEACARAFVKFCQSNGDRLPLPGQDAEFDLAMWEASQYLPLASHDESMVARVTGRMLGEQVDVVAAACVRLKDLLGNAKEAAVESWQEMLAGLSWQQMVPAGALRGVGGQMVSLGTFHRQLADANIQVNLGWLVDDDHLRVLLQARGSDEKALPDVELRLTESKAGVVFSRKTNQDGAVVAPNIQVGPGEYKIQVLWSEQVAETPVFVI